MTTFFTADLHFNHANVLRFSSRPFKDIVDHDKHLIDQINAVVGKHDQLWILGDVSWRSLGSEITRINCRDLHLIWGNHDRHNFGKHFKTADDVAEVRIDGAKLFLSHYAHYTWPGSHRGTIHLYGHSHAESEGTLDSLFPNRRSMDVGVDNAKRLLGEYRPFSQQEIMQLLMSRPGHEESTIIQDMQEDCDR